MAYGIDSVEVLASGLLAAVYTCIMHAHRTHTMHMHVVEQHA